MRPTWLILAAMLATTAAAIGAPGGRSHAAASTPRRGHPTVKLDQLEFPTDIAGAPFFKKQLRRILKHHAKRAEWGAGQGSVIQFRFSVTELNVARSDDVITVTCTAYGKLPRGKTAKSHLSFSGAPAQRNKLIVRVLEIVSRGVVTRLAEMERIRRGDLDHARIRAPSVPDVD